MSAEAQSARAHIDSLIDGLKAMEQIDLSNMANQFDRFNQILGETQKTTTSVLNKFVTTGKFDWKSLLRTPFQGGIDQTLGQVVPNLFKGLYRQAPATNNPAIPSGSPTDSMNSGLGFLGNMFGFGGQTASNLQSSNTPNVAAFAPKTTPITPPIATTQPIPVEVAPSAVAPLKVEVVNTPVNTPVDPGFTIPPMPKDQFEGMPERMIRTETPYGYIELPESDTNRIFGTPTPQPQSNIGGNALGLIGSLTGGNKYTGLLSQLGGLFGLSFADGGMVPRDPKFDKFREGDNPVAEALRREGVGSVIAALTPGERVLTVSESRYYQAMFPEGIKNYADGGVVGNIKPIPLNLDQRKIDNRGDSNEFNFNINNGDGGRSGGMTKEMVKEFESAVTAVMLKHKRSRSGLVPN
jgi:hypothetical protein